MAKIVIDDTREIELLDAIKNPDAINFKFGDKFAELTNDLSKTKGSPQLKFTKEDSGTIIENGLILKLDAKSLDKVPFPSTWNDESGNGNDVTLNNFSGTPDSGYNPTDDMLKFNGTPSYGSNNTIMGLTDNDFTAQVDFKYKAGTDGVFPLLSQSAGLGDFKLFLGIKNTKELIATVNSGDTSYLNSNPVLMDENTKYIVTLVYSRNGNTKIFINGINVGEKISQTQVKGLADLTIGILRTNEFIGGIKKILIYNRALSDTEIQNNYNAMRNEYYIREIFESTVDYNIRISSLHHFYPISIEGFTSTTKIKKLIINRDSKVLRIDNLDAVVPELGDFNIEIQKGVIGDIANLVVRRVGDTVSISSGVQNCNVSGKITIE